MTRDRDSERGSADGAALVAALVLGAAALAPALLVRRGEGWRKCNEEALRFEVIVHDRVPRIADALSAAASARAALEGSAFRPDPSRRLGPAPAAEGPAPVPAAGRVADLGGRVVEGRLSVRWTPSPGSTGTTLRIEGLSGPESMEKEVPSPGSTLDLPVPGTSGTIVVKASPAGVPAPAPEARVSIPYRIPVEVVRVERASEEEGTAVLRLRRAYDGRTVEAEFPLHEADPVGDLASLGPDGPAVDFGTDLVLEEVRGLRAPGPFVEVPLFGPDGRTQRDAEGHLLTYGRASTVDAGREVVLRGPNDERRVVPVR